MRVSLPTQNWTPRWGDDRECFPLVPMYWTWNVQISRRWHNVSYKPKYTGKIYRTGLPNSRLTCVTTPSTLQNIQHAPTMNKNIRYGRGADHRQMHNNSKGMQEEILALFAYLSNPFLEQTFCSKYTFSHFFYIHTIDVKCKHISNYSLALATRILLFDIP